MQIFPDPHFLNPYFLKSCLECLSEGVYFVWGQDVARIKKGPPIEKNKKHKENALYFQNIDRGALIDTRNGHDLCWLLRDVFKSYREEIDEFVKCMTQPYRNSLLNDFDKTKMPSSSQKSKLPQIKVRYFSSGPTLKASPSSKLQLYK